MSRSWRSFYEKLSKVKPEVLIASFSFLLSIYAVWKSQQQFKQEIANNIAHDKQSVRPVLNIIFHGDDHEKNLGLEVVNNGLGPATITRERILYLNNEYSSIGDMMNDIINKGKKFWKKDSTRDFSQWELVGKTLPPNKSYFILSVDSAKMNSLNKVIECFNDIQFAYQYSNIYNDSYWTCYQMVNCPF